MLSRLRAQNTRWRPYSEFLLSENVWLAQRFGARAALLDLGKERTAPLADLVEEWLALIQEDAAFFGCEQEVAGARRIVAEGTSADRQMRVYEAAIAAGASGEEALNAVVDHLIVETAAGAAAAAGAARTDHGALAIAAATL
jgi:carboxylate-amine ligase